MDGIAWLLLAFIVSASGVLAMVVVGPRRWRAEIEKSSHCPNCRTPTSPRQVSWFRSECPHCGARMRKRRGDGSVKDWRCRPT